MATTNARLWPAFWAQPQKSWPPVFPGRIREHLFCANLAELRPAPLVIAGEIIYPCEFTRLTNAQLSSLNLNQPSLRCRIAQGDQLAVVRCKEEIAHRALVQTRGAVRTEGQRNCFCLQEGQAYIHFCETTPQHRGRSLYPAALLHLLYTLKEQGKQEVFSARRTLA